MSQHSQDFLDGQARQSRVGFHITCSAVMIVVMGALWYALSLASTTYLEGLMTGAIGTSLLLWLCHKLGHRLF